MKTLALVVPCHNEARRLNENAFCAAIERWPWLSVCFVDDGSTDDTAEVIAHLAGISPAFHALHLPRNRGKAEAVRAGMRHLVNASHADLFGFWDADLATPLEELPKFVEAFEGHPALDAVIGSRWPHLGASIRRCAGRGVVGWLVKAFIRSRLDVPVWDTQCGAKIFTHAVTAKIFRDPFRTHWLFDVELLCRMGRNRLAAHVQELPVSVWRDMPGSNLGWRELPRIFRELLSCLQTHAVP